MSSRVSLHPLLHISSFLSEDFILTEFQDTISRAQRSLYPTSVTLLLIVRMGQMKNSNSASRQAFLHLFAKGSNLSFYFVRFTLSQQA